MGCANTKAGGATAYGAPEECPDGEDSAQAGSKEVPKMLVDGETPPDIAVNGNVVVSNGTEEEETGAEKEACNGDLTVSAKEADEDATAPSTDTKSNNALNGAGEEGSDRSSAQDGDQKADENADDGGKEQSEADEKNEAVTAESRDSQQEEADDKME